MLITKKEAERVLGVTSRTIYRYIEKGYLKQIDKNKRLYLDSEEVEGLKKALEDPVKDIDKTIISKLFAMIKEQRSEIDTIKRILNLYYEPLELEDFSIKAYYSTALDLKIETWPEGWRSEWPLFIMRLREEDLFQLEKVVSDPHPWKPFLKMIMVIQEILKKEKDIQHLELFSAARKHLNNLITVWCEIKGEPKVHQQMSSSEFGKFTIARLREKLSK